MPMKRPSGLPRKLPELAASRYLCVFLPGKKLAAQYLDKALALDGMARTRCYNVS
jgi:hypothetical protein